MKRTGAPTPTISVGKFVAFRSRALLLLVSWKKMGRTFALPFVDVTVTSIVPEGGMTTQST